MLLALADGADRRGWQFRALFAEVARERPWLDELRAAGVEFGFLPRDRDRARSELARQVPSLQRPAILHTHFSRFDVPAVLAARGSGDCKVVWHEHSDLAGGPRALARNIPKYVAFARLAERIVCVTPTIAEQVRRRGAPRGRVEYLPNAIDTTRFRLAGPDERAAARKGLGIPDGSRVLLHFGWDWHRKGGDLFLSAVRELGERPLVALTVGGRQSGEDPASVRVLPPADDVAGLYAAADVFVSPSRAEGMPFALLEALSRGVAVVATDIPGQRLVGGSLAAHRMTGFDPIELAQAIGDLLGRPPEQVRADAAEAHEWIRAHFDAEQWSERVLAIYDELLGR